MRDTTKFRVVKEQPLYAISIGRPMEIEKENIMDALLTYVSSTAANWPFKICIFCHHSAVQQETTTCLHVTRFVAVAL